jgi:drug/metabolite transporter (DMT)-like permease
MQIWIPIAIFAAFTQNLRFMLQKHLKATGLSTAGATFSRFVFGFPLAALFVFCIVIFGGYSVPQVRPSFFAFSMTGGVAQILATMCVVALFAERNFTVGIVFKKTEVLQTAVIGFIFLSETISIWGIASIAIGFFGVLLLSDKKGETAGGKRFLNRATALGLASGALFGVSAVGYRGASLSLIGGDFIIRASVTLAFVTAFQTVVMALWLSWREKAEIGRVLSHWRVTALVGLTGVLGSMGWFMAFTLQNAAYVKALGQIELVFTFLASYFVFKERSTAREIGGTALIVASILVLILTL